MTRWIWVVVLGGIGILLLGFAANIAMDSVEKTVSGVATDAVITGYEQHIDTTRNDDGSTTTSESWRPMFRFQLPDGTDVDVTTSSGSSWRPYANGQTIEILYLERDPQGASLKSFGDMWMGSSIVAYFGVFMILASAAMLVGDQLYAETLEEDPPWS